MVDSKLSRASIAGAGALAAYLFYVRPRQLRWGATDDEVVRQMPGDDVVSRPTFNATRAVSINADRDDIWPWLLQMGVKRGGWYSYDLIDNLGRASSRRIMPEYQHLAVGDLIPMSPVGGLGLYVKDFEPGQWMLWWDKAGACTWCWGLYPVAIGQTRLVSRVRLRYDWFSPSILFNLALDLGDIVMMRKCMLGIKARAESLAVQSSSIDLTALSAPAR